MPVIYACLDHISMDTSARDSCTYFIYYNYWFGVNPRRFTRLVLIDGIGMLPYSERLEAMNLTSLCERCIRGDLIETFKIVSGVAYYGIRVE